MDWLRQAEQWLPFMVGEQATAQGSWVVGRGTCEPLIKHWTLVSRHKPRLSPPSGCAPLPVGWAQAPTSSASDSSSLQQRMPVPGGLSWG